MKEIILSETHLAKHRYEFVCPDCGHVAWLEPNENMFYNFFECKACESEHYDIDLYDLTRDIDKPY